MSIPRIFHFFWTGPAFTYMDYMAVYSTSLCDPSFKIIMWYDEAPVGNEWWIKLGKLCEKKNVTDELRHEVPGARYNERSDYVKYRKLYDIGGITLDTDLLVLKSFEDLLHHNWFAGRMDKQVAVGVMGSEPGGRLVKLCADNIKKWIGARYGKTGPELLSRFTKDLVPGELILEKDEFYPIHYKHWRQIFQEGPVPDCRVLHYWAYKSRGLTKNIKPGDKKYGIISKMMAKLEGQQFKKIYFINDTSSYHSGSRAVVESIYKQLRPYEIIAAHKLGRFEVDDELMERCDLVLANGEGTLFHNIRHGNFVMKVLRRAQEMGKKTALINTVFEKSPPYYPDVLNKLDLLAVREPLSFRCAEKCGGRPLLLIDSCVGSDTDDGKPLRDLSGVVIGDTMEKKASKALHKVRPGNVRFGVPKRNSFKDFVATLKQCSVYVTGRHHGIYAAVLAGIAFVPLPTISHKIRSMVEWPFFPMNLCKNDEIESIEYAIDYAIKNPDAFKDFRDFLLSQDYFMTKHLKGII